MLSREYANFYIDGEWQQPDSKERLEVVSSRSGEVIGYVPMASTSDVDRAVEAARKAFWEGDWRHRSVEELGCTYGIADFYHSVAPTLHWNYAAAVGRGTSFSEVREADLSPLAGGGGAGIVKFASKSLVVKEPVGLVA